MQPKKGEECSYKFRSRNSSSGHKRLYERTENHTYMAGKRFVKRSEQNNKSRTTGNIAVTLRLKKVIAAGTGWSCVETDW